MFDYCKLRNEICPLATDEKGVLYCGQATGENRVVLIKSCPLVKQKTAENKRFKGLSDE